MTKFLVCLAAALSFLSASAQSADKQKLSVEDQIAKLEHAWVAAQKSNDYATIDSLLAENFTEVDADGTVMHKSQILDDAKTSKYESVEVSDLKITLFGDTAIVIGNYDAKHFDKDGKPLQDHERFVDTWHKMPGGKWLCIAQGNAVIR